MKEGYRTTSHEMHGNTIGHDPYLSSIGAELNGFLDAAGITKNRSGNSSVDNGSSHLELPLGDGTVKLHAHNGEVTLLRFGRNAPFAQEAVSVPIVLGEHLEDSHKQRFTGFSRTDNDGIVHFHFTADAQPEPDQREAYVQLVHDLSAPFERYFCAPADSD